MSDGDEQRITNPKYKCCMKRRVIKSKCKCCTTEIVSKIIDSFFCYSVSVMNTAGTPGN